MSMHHAQYVLLFLVLVANSDRFQILQSYTLLPVSNFTALTGFKFYGVTRSYSSCPFLWESFCFLKHTPRCWASQFPESLPRLNGSLLHLLGSSLKLIIQPLVQATFKGLKLQWTLSYPVLSYLEYSVIRPWSLHILFNVHAAYRAK